MFCGHVVVILALHNIRRIDLSQDRLSFFFFGVEVEEGGGVLSIGVAPNNKVVVL